MIPREFLQKGTGGNKKEKGEELLGSHFGIMSGGMTMKRFAAVTFLLVMFLLWNTPMVIAQFSEAGVEQFKVAVNAPDFTLRKLGGGDLSLKDLKGRVVILNFFATY